MSLGTLTSEEVEEYLVFEFDRGAETLQEQMRRWYLHVKKVNRDNAELMKCDIEENLGSLNYNNFTDGQVVGLSVIVDRYAPGAVICLSEKVLFKGFGVCKHLNFMQEDNQKNNPAEAGSDKVAGIVFAIIAIIAIALLLVFGGVFLSRQMMRPQVMPLPQPSRIVPESGPLQPVENAAPADAPKVIDPLDETGGKL